MRKIIIALVSAMAFALMLTAFVCADSIKRFETDEFQSGENITYIDGINEDMYLSDSGRNNSFNEILDPSFTARAVLQNGDGTYTTYPSWYFISFIHYWNGAEYQYTMDRINAMSETTGETYESGDVIRFEFPEYKSSHSFSIKPNMPSLGMTNAVYVRVASHFESVSFRNMRNLVEIEYAPTSNIKTISDKAFVDCQKIEVIRFPNSVTKIGSEIVCYWSTSSSTAQLKEIYLGANAESLGNKNPFNTAKVNGLKIYVPETIDGSVYGASTFPTTAVVIFTGSYENAQKFGFENMMSYEEYVAAGEVAEAGTMVYGYSPCDAFYGGEHIASEGEYVFEGEKYSSNYCFVTECTVEGCNVTQKETVCMPLYVNKGYSTENTGNGFSFGITFNKDAIKSYEEIEGTTFNYGFVAGKITEGDGGNVVNKNGEKAIDNVFTTLFTNTEYELFTVKVTGIDNAEYKAKDIYCSAFVIDGENVYYVGNNVTSTAVAVSYDKIFAGENTTDEE